MSEFYRGENGEAIEVRYLDIPDMPAGEVDEIVCGPMHLETLDSDRAYITVAGLMVNIVAVKRGRLSITCEPDSCTLVDAPAEQIDWQARAERSEAALERAEKNVYVRFEDWGGMVMCQICDQAAQAEDRIDHAPDCPFAVLGEAVAPAGDQGGG